MRCFFINLDHEVEKSNLINERFKKVNDFGLTLNRFSAIGKEYVSVNKIQGELTSGAKGCFLSHRQVINNNINSEDHIWLMEDDVVFSKGIQQYINSAIDSIPGKWDMLYTDICIPDPKTMIDFYNARKKIDQGVIGTTDLKEINFCSTASYIVNKKSIKLIAEILNSLSELNTPIDILYRELIHHGSLSGYAIFPFVTTLSELAANSNIQKGEFSYTETIWRAFRRYIWIDAELEQINSDLEILHKGEFTASDRAFTWILSAFYAKEFILK